jgi:hypothetical protein
MNPAARMEGSTDCNRPDLALRLSDGEEIAGSFGKEIEHHSRSCAACSLRLSLVRQAERWIADQGSSNRAAVSSSTPCPEAEALYDFGSGPGARELSAVESRRIEAHLVECADCRALVATLASRPPAPLLDREHAPRPILSVSEDAAPPARRVRRPWFSYAAAAAILCGAVYFWNADDAAHGAQGLESARAEISFPVLPVLPRH